MNSPSSLDTIAQFLKTIRPRCRDTYKVYTCILRGFHRHLAEQDAQVSADTIRNWLKQCILEWPLPLVIHRARLVDRYLDWAKAHDVVARNPLAELRERYGGLTAPIVRAMLSDNLEHELERLRPLPEFGSALGPEMRQHVQLLRSLGYRAEERKEMLLRFDRFLQRRPDLRNEPLLKLVQAWSEAGCSPRHVLDAQRCGQVLSEARHRLDPAVPILRVDRGLRRRVVRPYRRPRVFTESEVRQLFEAARSFASPKAPLRPLTVYTMLAVMYCAGLRVGELARLKLADVSFDNGTLEIRGTKFFKSRRLPLAPDVVELLSRYVEARRAAGAALHEDAGLFWHEHLHGAYAKVTIQQLITKIMRGAGLKPVHGCQGPRVHDVRHSFVAHLMLSWYRSGVATQSRLPYLATYLGHKDIRSTLVYLTATEDLLHLANERFKQYSDAMHRAIGGRP
jgi:integrase/recombinase XerD